MISRFLPAALLFLLAVPLQADNSTWKLAPFGTTEKLLGATKTRLDAWKALPVELDCVRGETVSFQFVISAGNSSLELQSAAPTPLASIAADFIAPQNFAFFRENYVRVAHPSGTRIQTPKWWPDALVPLEIAPKTIESGADAVFWATLRIPPDAAPGDYYGELDIAANGDSRRLALSVRVRAGALPDSRFRATVALYYDSLRDWYRKNGNPFSDEDWAAQKQRYANFLLDFGLNPYDPPVAWNDPKIDSYLKDARVHSVRTPPLDSPDFPAALEALKRSATQSKAFYYWNDEPQTNEQFAAIRANSAKLRALQIPQLVTVHPAPELAGSVDIWCPNISNALGSGHLDIIELRREQKLGRATWIYTMVVPKYPYPTWFLDDDSSAVLSFAPLWSKIGASGFVYSMAHGWGPKPLENLESFGGTNGDGTLLYPSELVGGVGPMPSVRLMLLRDAVEDLALWNEAARRKIAPAFSFPARRNGALIYNRTVLLDALESGKMAPQKLDFSPQLFPLLPTPTVFRVPFARALGARRVQITVQNGALQVRVFGQPLREHEELVVLLAPFDIEKRTFAQRFALRYSGEIGVSTRANSSNSSVILVGQASVLQQKNAFGLILPFPSSPNRVRFNVLIRSTGGTVRLFPDGNDPFLMPQLQLR